MKTKLIVAALLTSLSTQVSAEVYKCQVNGKTIYQQSPCVGQVDTAQPMKMNDNDKSLSDFDKSLSDYNKWLDKMRKDADEARKKSEDTQKKLEERINDLFGENNPPLEYEVLHITLTPDEIAKRVSKAKNVTTQVPHCDC